jgi:hypothetical protein
VSEIMNMFTIASTIGVGRGARGLRTAGRSRHHWVAVRFVGVLLVSLCALALVAGTPALAAGACSNEQRRAEQPFELGLADCRAYEMVSPLAKGDNSVIDHRGRAAASGEAVSYFSAGSFAEPKAALLSSPYLSRREAGGWSTRNISPPFTDYRGAATTIVAPFEEQLFTSDLSRGIVESPFTPLVSGQPIGYINLYVANTETGAYEAVTTVTPEKEYKPFTESFISLNAPEGDGGSSDLSHIVFQQLASLCCGASPHQLHVYEWAEGSLRQVDVTPQGGQFAGPANVGAAGQPSRDGNPWRAVSSDGSRVVFTGGENLPGVDPSWGQVYVRENPMSPVEGCGVAGDACTVEVSASQRTNGRGEPEPDPNAGKQPVAWYRDASADGSRVFFTSRVELTNDANTGPEDNAANLYEYNVESGVLTDLTVDTNPEDIDGAGVLGLVTAGEDGSYVYFVAEGKLAGEANSEGKEAVSGQPNLYLSHANKVTFIATLSSVGNNSGEPVGDETDWTGREISQADDYGPGAHTARVTPDGTRLAFESELSLTKYDNEAAGPGECENERCREVYLYDATTGKLICASCGPQSDERPVGPAELKREVFSFDYLRRNLSDNGRRLFFETKNPLVPYDSNGRLDVYEWEQVGEGSCTIASASYAASEEGCTFPVSDVTGALESHFLDASANGDDVFIATADRLVPSDTDDREDVYDVRVGGGFPVASVPPVCEEVDSCRSPASAQPSGLFGSPASQAFSGPGNPVAPVTAPVVTAPKQRAKSAKCRKGLVQKRGRCVKRKRGRTTAHRARQSGFDGRRR